jgi:hypothetical protein
VTYGKSNGDMLLGKCLLMFTFEDTNMPTSVEDIMRIFDKSYGPIDAFSILYYLVLLTDNLDLIHCFRMDLEKVFPLVYQDTIHLFYLLD